MWMQSLKSRIREAIKTKDIVAKGKKRDGVNIRFRVLKYMSNKVWTYSNKVIKKWHMKNGNLTTTLM